MSPVGNLLYQACEASRGGVKEALFRSAWQSKGHLEMEF